MDEQEEDTGVCLVLPPVLRPIDDEPDGAWEVRGIATLQDLDWYLEYTAQMEAGRFVLTSVTVKKQANSSYDDGGLTSTVLRQVPLGRVSAEIRNWLLDTSVFQRPVDLKATADVAREKDRVGRPALSDAHYRQVAEVRIRYGRDGQGAIHRRMAEKWGREESTVKGWISTTRSLGYLEKGLRGRDDAFPGPRLLAEWAAEGLTLEDALRRDDT